MSIFKRPEFEEKLDEPHEEAWQQKQTQTIDNSKISILYSDVVIHGEISCENSLSVYGEVNGSIHCKDMLLLESDITADVQGGDITIRNARIVGNVVSNNTLSIDNDSEIKGDISADTCTLNGKVFGNLTIKDALSIQKNALVKGDIQTSELSMIKGSRIEGYVTMGKKNY